MKLRNRILFCALIVAILSALPATQCTTASSVVGTPPNVVVEEFYKWYIHSVSHQIDPFKAGKTTLQKYVTPRFMRKVQRIAREMASGGYDGDYFLEAQRDYPDSPNLEDEWVKNMSTSKLTIKGPTAAVSISFGENGALAKERINLLQEGGIWKIDDVKNGSSVGLVK
ncbi:MAG TPA: hypothetical protein DCK93_02950 [Blastocatellia bacterium]|nr:hypothetical protein [Blastocatellia bacterium]